MVARSISGGGSTRTHIMTRSKAHFFKSLDLTDVITPADDTPGTFTGTKLIAALGPSSHSVPVLEAMLNAGMVAARIDLSWGGLDFHRESLRALNTAMANTKKLTAIIVETLGREVMVRRPCVLGPDGWPAHPEPLSITMGETITLTTRPDVEASDKVLPVTYPKLHNMCEPGDTIYIGRYLVCGSDSASLYLSVVQVDDRDIICTAQNSAVMDGLLTVFHMERSSDTLLNLQNTLPLLSDYDISAISALGEEFEIDYISVSYTRTREDVREARQFLDSLGLHSTRVLAKVETRQALLNFRGIVSTADGIIVSRGNIGLDVAPEKMALVQKQLISNCNLLGKPVLITRVVDSMVNNPRPTRAEATDIANAVLDGVDGILLGAETLRGDYPVEAVATIAQICRVAESVFDADSHYDHLMAAAQDMEDVVKSAAQAADSGPHLGRANGGGKSVGFRVGPKDDSYDSLEAGNASEDGGSEAPNLAAGLLGQDSTASAGGMTHDSSSYQNLQGLVRNTSFASLQAAYQEVHAFAKYGGAASVSAFNHKGSYGSISERYAAAGLDRLPFLSKLESLASSAVRAAGKVQADLIVVYTATGRTAQLVAKYRPPMPILTLVVPRLMNDGIRWRLEGRSTARACQLTRGLLPVLATPGPNGDAALECAIVAAAAAGLLAPRHHVVVLQQVHDELCVKVMSLDKSGRHVAGSQCHLRDGLPVASRVPAARSTGALVDSDGESYEGDAQAEGDDEFSSEGEELLAGLGSLQRGSFGVSPSINYRGEHAKAVVASKKGKRGSLAVPRAETPTGSTASPSTPSQPTLAEA